MNTSLQQQKKHVLMNLIDDMAAAALDRSSQGYSQFLNYRKDLISLVDIYMEEDRERLEFVSSTMLRAQELFKKDFTNRSMV